MASADGANASDFAGPGATTILVCTTCRRPGDPEEGVRPGAALARATATAATAASGRVGVRRVRCLANCQRGLTAAIRHDGAWTYVFGELNAETGADALIEGARLLAGAADGLMPWRGRPTALKRGLIARIPPTDYEDAE